MSWSVSKQGPKAEVVSYLEGALTGAAYEEGRAYVAPEQRVAAFPVLCLALAKVRELPTEGARVNACGHTDPVNSSFSLEVSSWIPPVPVDSRSLDDPEALVDHPGTL